MPIKLNSTGGGSVTLDTPSTANNYTLTAPASSGTILTTASTTGINGSAIDSGTVAEAYGGTGSNYGWNGFKNRLINGAMQVDQRNNHGSFTVGTGVTAYQADRWYVYSNGGQTFGNTNADSSLSGFSYSMTLVPQTGATSVQLNQRIESYNIADCAGQTVTLSFWIYTSGLGVTSSYVQPYTPTAQDNYSSGTYGASQAISYTNGSWVKNTFTFSTSNGGMNAANGLAILFNFQSAVGATIKITGVQLEKSSTATSFNYRPYGTELVLCQRYYQFGTNRMVKQNCDTLRNSYDPTNFPMTMRTAPTLTNTNTSSTYVGTANVAIPSANGFSFLWNSTNTIDFQNTFNWTASAEL